MIRNHNERTIEGDLFSAFVAAGAISKANGDDPKKSSLIRCARTDKGVHAAGNLISLKLILEDPEIVTKINEKLSPQIRVFGLTRTNGSFNAYQFCDSRIYEYLIPTHVFLPPHPNSFLGKKLVELAEEAGNIEEYQKRQSEVSTFWEETEEQFIKPILEQLDPSIRPIVLKALYDSGTRDTYPDTSTNQQHKPQDEGQSSTLPKLEVGVGSKKLPAEKQNQRDTTLSQYLPTLRPEDPLQQPVAQEVDYPTQPLAGDMVKNGSDLAAQNHGLPPNQTDVSPLELAIKNLKAAYTTAKNAYRIHPARLARVRSSLSRYVGSQNYHNYTVHKSFHDASAIRVIKSFVVHGEPLLINDTEWLSLKVHGQSFMMHQIRKMISMVALMVRCGCHEGRLQDSYMQDRITIPKAPGLGLLLERPVFDTYNEKLVGEFGREGIDFGRYEKEMEEFKQREIYERIFREEERDHQFVFPLYPSPKTLASLNCSHLVPHSKER